MFFGGGGYGGIFFHFSQLQGGGRWQSLQQEPQPVAEWTERGTRYKRVEAELFASVNSASTWTSTKRSLSRPLEIMFIPLSLRYVTEHYVNFSKRISPLSRPCRKTYQAKNLYKICRHMSNSNSKLEANVRGTLQALECV